MKNKGFTLIEIMIALSIASITIVTLYKLHIQNIDAGINQSFDIIAPILAQEKMNSIEPPFEKSEGSFKDDYNQYSFKVISQKSKLETLDKIKVDVSVSNGKRTYTLRRYFFSDGK